VRVLAARPGASFFLPGLLFPPSTLFDNFFFFEGGGFSARTASLNSLEIFSVSAFFPPDHLSVTTVAPLRGGPLSGRGAHAAVALLL